MKGPGPVWGYSMMVVTVLFIICIIIYGFDITVPEGGRRKAITSQINNTGKVNYYFRINDTWAFGVFTDREPGNYDVTATTYTLNYIPWCFFCGWYTGDIADDRGVGQPHKQGDLIYTIEALSSEYAGLPRGAYATFNLKTKEFGHVMDLNEISSDAADEKYRVSQEWVFENYDEISYSSSDDEDCFIAFGGVFLCYSILLVWGFIAVVVKNLGRKRA